MKKLLWLGVLLLSSNVYAADIQVEDAWARPTSEGRTTANVYFHITSKQNAKLLGASSPAAKSAILRSMIHNEQGMKIIDLNEVELSAGKRLDMTSEHKQHVTLIDLKAPLKAGSTVPLTLNITTEDKQDVKVDVKVEVRAVKK